MTVSAGTVLGGHPATIVRRDFDKSQLRQMLSSDIELTSLLPQ